MGIKNRLIVMNFLQFFIWACWLITIGAYWFQNKGWSGAEFGAIFSTMGIASLFMPTLAGIIADKYINAESLLAEIETDKATMELESYQDGIQILCYPHSFWTPSFLSLL